MRRLLFTLLLSTLPLLAADIIPSTLRVSWRPGVEVGVYGGIPVNRTEWTNFITAGADPTCVTNNEPILQALADACPDDKYIYIPPGRYRMSNDVNLANNNNYSIAGAGTGSVFFCRTRLFSLDNINASTARVKGALAKGDTNLTIFSVGDLAPYIGNNLYINSRREGHSLRLINVDNGDRILSQSVRLLGVVNGTNLTFWPPLVWEHPEVSEPWLSLNATTQSKRIGLENFAVTGTNAPTGESIDIQQVFITLYGAQDFWIKRLHFTGARDFCLSLVGCVSTEVRDSYWRSGTAGSGSGIIIASGDTGDLLENNYNAGGAPFAQYNASVGNVIGYNYCITNVSDDYYQANPFDSHEPHSMMNLWEGNRGNMFQSDSYFGSSSHQTLYKNWFTAYDGGAHFGLPRAIDLGRWSRSYNIAGNVLGSPEVTTYWYTTTNQYYTQTQPVIFRFGYPNPGNPSYGYGSAAGLQIQTPNTDWRYPGSNRFGGTITSATGTGTSVTGNFSTVQDGDQLAIQSQLNTNLYYPSQTNYPRLAASGAGTESGLTFNKEISWTNGDALYRIGPNAYQTLQFSDSLTHLITGNYDRTNNAQMYVTNDLPPSLYLSVWQAWMTNRAGAALPWPWVNPTNAVVGDWPARSQWEDSVQGGSPSIAIGNRAIIGRTTGQ